MRKTPTILLEDTRTPPEELTAVEEEASTRRVKAASTRRAKAASTRMAKVSVATVVDAAADPGLLKNIEIKVR